MRDSMQFCLSSRMFAKPGEMIFLSWGLKNSFNWQSLWVMTASPSGPGN